MSEFNLSTSQLTTHIITFLTKLGFPGVTSGERWENDGVYIVGSPPRNDHHQWYLYVSGNDNENYEAGVSLVLIQPKPKHDEVLELNSLKDLPGLLTQHGHYPLN